MTSRASLVDQYLPNSTAGAVREDGRRKERDMADISPVQH
jgi:hypothetical protein